ncbi:hypothetical protein M0813_09365 [Anaeramoeba flamelloides]|uniref:Mannosyltransferase n=1 Tax=Anaeramoeba flamelloides TaxID=1746091 RepID=A0ABQ8X5M5_9EUKA|nr:hypothetical protein M0813_09365 [Anaeramoeba flamelloides]
MVSVLIRIYFGIHFGTLHNWIIIVLIILLFLVSVLLSKPKKEDTNPGQMSIGMMAIIKNEIRQHYIFYLVSFLLLLPLLIYLFDIHYIPISYSGVQTRKNCYGDLPFHLTLINSFLHGCNSRFRSLQSLQFPVLSDSQLSYPFLMDYSSALWASGGLNLRATFVFQGATLTLSLLVLIYYFYLRVFKSPYSKIRSLLSTIMILFVGGYGWVQYFIQPEQGKLKNYIDYLFKPDANNELFWISFLDGTLLPQRSTLLGYPLLIIIFKLLYIQIEKNNPSINRQMILATILTSLTPLSHFHSYFTIGFILSFLSILTLISQFFPSKMVNNKNQNENKTITDTSSNNSKSSSNNSNNSNSNSNDDKINIKKKKKIVALQNVKSSSLTRIFKWCIFWAVFAILSNLLALPQLLFYFPRFTGDHLNFLHIFPVWNSSNFSAIQYLVYSLGTVLILSFAGIPLLNRIQLLFYTPFLILAITCCFILFQPWKIDNIKLLNIWMIMAVGITNLVIVKIITFGKKFLKLKCNSKQDSVKNKKISNNNGNVHNNNNNNNNNNSKSDNDDLHKFNQNKSIKLKKYLKYLVFFLIILISISIFLSCILSGILSTIRLKNQESQIQSVIDINVGEFIINNTPHDSIFISNSDFHANPLHTIAGRQILCGYSGWLWTHGLDFTSKKYEMKEMIRANEKISNEQLHELYEKYNVTYILIYNNDSIQLSQRVINEINFMLIYFSPKISIYKKILLK